MSKFKVLVITTSYAQESTGKEAAGSFVNAFVRDLHNMDNVEVRVVYPSVIKQTNSDFQKPFKVEFLPLSVLKLTNIFHWTHIFNTLLTGQKAVINEAIDFQPNYILALWALPSGYWARKAAFKLNIKYSNWCLGSDIWSLAKIPVVKGMLKKVLINAQVNFADGYQLCQDVKNLSSKDCMFLPSSRKLNYQQAKPLIIKDKLNLCFIGRWHENKGIDILLDSLALLNNSDLEKIHSIVIAGGGQLEDMVKKKVKHLQKQGLPIQLLGFVDKEKATELISNSDFMLIPSRIESIPVIFSDAIQLLRPVIAMPVGDLPVLLNKYSCGILSKNVNAESYSLAIIEALQLDVKIINRNLEYTRRDFYINQMNHVKFIKSARTECNQLS